MTFKEFFYSTLEGRKRLISDDDLLAAAEMYEKGEASIDQLADLFNVNPQTIKSGLKQLGSYKPGPRGRPANPNKNPKAPKIVGTPGKRGRDNILSDDEIREVIRLYLPYTDGSRGYRIDNPKSPLYGEILNGRDVGGKGYDKKLSADEIARKITLQPSLIGREKGFTIDKRTISKYINQIGNIKPGRGSREAF